MALPTLEDFDGYMATWQNNHVAAPATAYQGLLGAIRARMSLPDETQGPTGQMVRLPNIETLRVMLADLEPRVALTVASDASVVDRKRIIKSRVSYGA